ncbi:hypothetical protein GCM10022251_48540 [Phytohabitans flavus]|uniref:Uncharacterized protein n=1 Tax=Phytohabitans flavus TaxID=1076124 RepID=A0A6F8XSU0_9ACTN|nr:hypothetical protein [Phytohabitans flavus]BCB76893.1 hypothetical protein Pflav_033030 [Phytohabitans flavus]
MSGATAVGDWSVVGQLADLRWLSFDDVQTIDSVDFVLRLGALQRFYATGNTKVADGRVAQLGSHPVLRTIGLAQSRRHDATAAEIRKRLGGFRPF